MYLWQKPRRGGVIAVQGRLTDSVQRNHTADAANDKCLWKTAKQFVGLLCICNNNDIDVIHWPVY